MWKKEDLTFNEVLRRNFWFCAVNDQTGFDLRHRIGIDRITVETDYPHSDTSRPDTQPMLDRQLQYVPAEEAAAITYGNAAELFRHPIPNDLAAAWLDVYVPN